MEIIISENLKSYRNKKGNTQEEYNHQNTDSAGALQSVLKINQHAFVRP